MCDENKTFDQTSLRARWATWEMWRSCKEADTQHHKISSQKVVGSNLISATFFTHEISVKVFLHHLAVEVVRGTCESCKMYHFISCCRCTWIKKMYLKKLHIDRKAKHAKTHIRTAEQKKWPWQLICKSICWPAPLNYCQAIPIVFLSTKLNTHNIKKMWRKGGRWGGGLKEERRGNLNGGKW